MLASPTVNEVVLPLPPTGKDVPCVYCGTTVVGSAFVVCASCDVPAHRDCWAEATVCSAYGCGSTQSLDPALALFRKPTPCGGTDIVAASTAVSRDSVDLKPLAPTPVATAPDVQTQSWVSRLGAMVGAFGGTRFSVVSVDVNLGPMNPGALFGGLTRFFRSRPPSEHPAVASIRAVAQDPVAEARLIEDRLAAARLRRWIRWVGFFGGFLLMPLALKMISKSLVFPLTAALMAWITFPGWRGKDDKRALRAMEARLLELAALQAPKSS